MTVQGKEIAVGINTKKMSARSHGRALLQYKTSNSFLYEKEILYHIYLNYCSGMSFRFHELGHGRERETKNEQSAEST